MHLCLPLDAEAVGIKRGLGAIQAKETRERGKALSLNREQAFSEETPQTERTAVKWPEENTVRFSINILVTLGLEM